MKFRFKKLLKIVFLTLFVIFICLEVLYQVIKHREKGAPETVTLEFTLYQDPDIYMRSYGREPPQFAVWLEDSARKKIKTVYVTHKAGTGNWEGIKENPIALPYWNSRRAVETGDVEKPTIEENNLDVVTGATPKFWRTIRRILPFMSGWLDAMTGATPKDNEISKSINVWAKSEWNYYIEVNCAGDFNDDFPMVLDDGTSDHQGNGQPSVIFKGSILAETGQNSTPILIGRTNQWQPVDSINTDLSGISSASRLLTNISATCKQKPKRDLIAKIKNAFKFR